jgi:PAS domain S-box-containing protein
MLTIFNWEIRNKLQSNQLLLKQQLRKSEAKYMEVVENSTDIIYSIDSDGYVISSNKQGYVLLNYLLEDLIGIPFKEISTKETFLKLETALKKIKREGSVFLGEGQLIRKNGEALDVTTHSVAMYDSENNFLGVRLIIRDITEHKHVEAEFQKIEKLESVGIMAGGIAHDFNNSLTTIAGNISLARASAKKNDNISGILKDAQKACVHAKNLTNQLLIFSAGGSPIKKVTTIKTLLEDSANFALRGSPINCEITIAEDLWPIEIDEGQITQVIHNLAINAKQAMPKGGKIEIIAKNISTKEKVPAPLHGAKHIIVTVKDHGTGIPKSILNKIFDPFFTTKEKGSGLGLASTYSIIMNHDGHIDVQSEVGVGTAFNIYLPASNENATAGKKQDPVTTKGAGHILIMDDEKNVRKSIVNMLNYMGYEADTAKNGERAIELYKKAMESSRPYDAVIIDLTIRGGMGGKDAIKKLIDIDPSIKAIVSSGYFNNPIMAAYKQYGFSGVIPKPYEMEDLSELLDKVINEK